MTSGYLGVTGQTILPSNHNPPLEDIRDNGLSAVLVRDGRAPMTGPLNMGTTNKIVNLAAGSSPADAVNFLQLSTITLTGAQNQGMIYGVTLSNNAADATNDIDISVGSAAADTSPYAVMTLASTLTKRLDAAWAVGTNQGGLDTGSIANTTYHVWLIQRSDTGVVDALFSTSATAPTMPANYDRKRRIGSIIRESAAIVAFSQSGDNFLRSSPIADLNNVLLATTAVLAALSVPAGITVDALMRCAISNGATLSSSVVLITSPSETDRAPNGVAGDYDAQIQTTAAPLAFGKTVRVNTSRQMRYRGGNTTTGLTVATYGWVDTRGRT